MDNFSSMNPNPNINQSDSDKIHQYVEKLRQEQDFISAILGGIIAAFVGSLIWAVTTVLTQYQIGFMAVAVGLLVGFSVRIFGKGIHPLFGVIGALFSLAGCLLGNLLSLVGFAAATESIGYCQILAQINPTLAFQLLAETFRPLDLLFYGIATYEGYRFSLISIDAHKVKFSHSPVESVQAENNKIGIRLSLAGVVLAIFLGVFYLVGGSDDVVTSSYPSGAKASQGRLVGGIPEGKWTYWYESGAKQSEGNYLNGIEDSIWVWWNEDGTLLKKGYYEIGMLEGNWEFYFPNGQKSDEGAYQRNRKNGLWISWYESGAKFQESHYENDKLHGRWISWYENGHVKEEGSYKFDKPAGKWTRWYENGQKNEELEFDNGEAKIYRVWDQNGKVIVARGNGIYKSYYDNGKLKNVGQVRNGKYNGQWRSWYENGKLREEGIYLSGEYKLKNWWNNDGNQIIKGGKGVYIQYHSSGNKAVEGNYVNGQMDGVWKYWYPGGALMQEIQYHQGLQNGISKAWYEDGSLYYEGNMSNNLSVGEWRWWFENGQIESSATFVEGQKEGIQTFWAESGRIIKEEVYLQGSLIEEKIY